MVLELPWECAACLCDERNTIASANRLGQPRPTVLSSRLRVGPLNHLVLLNPRQMICESPTTTPCSGTSIQARGRDDVLPAKKGFE